MRLSGLLPLLRLCDGSFRRAERDETELVLLTPQHQREPRASRGCEVPARPSRNLALQCLCGAANTELGGYDYGVRLSLLSPQPYDDVDTGDLIALWRHRGLTNKQCRTHGD